MHACLVRTRFILNNFFSVIGLGGSQDPHDPPLATPLLGLRVGGHPALSLHSSNEPGELSHCCGYYYYYLHTIIGLTQKTTHGAKSKKLFFLRSYSTYSRLGDKIIRPVQIVIQIFPKVFIMEQVE